MSWRARLIGVLLLAVLGAVALWHVYARVTPRVVVEGGEAGGLPRAQPDDERLDPVALQNATRDPAAAHLSAFIVMHHNHIVFERYGHGLSAEAIVDGGGFARALVGLLAGIATQEDHLPVQALNGFDPNALRSALEAASHMGYAQYLSRRLWRPLNAAPAWIELSASAAPTPADCCLHARVMDWMRIASLLLDDGRFQTKPLVPAGWVARMRRPASADARHGFGIELAAAASGAQAFATDQMFFLRGNGHWRLWLMPALNLAVLFGDDPSAPASADWDETRLPLLVSRALAPGPGQSNPTLLQQLVPNH